ncbi:hypothetical protein STEG23_029005 [Scotinomys teguina]
MVSSPWQAGFSSSSQTGVFSSCCLALDSSSSFPCPAFRAIAKSGEEDPIWVPRRLTRILKDASMDDDVPDEPADALDEPTAGEDGAKMGDPVSVSEFDASPA